MIRIFGSLFDPSGYSSHTRGLSQAMFKLNPEIALDVPKPVDWVRNCPDDFMNMLTKRSDIETDTVICIGMPQSWPIILSENPKKFYGYVIWEGEKIPKFWMEYLLDPRITGILVPSEHVKKAIIETARFYEGMPRDYVAVGEWGNKIHVIPHGVDKSIFQPQEKDEQDKDKFIFVANKGWNQGMNDRGGMQWVIKAFAEEFKKDEKVELRVKLNPAYIDQTFNFEKAIEALDIPKERAMIRMNMDGIQQSKMATFYAGDVFVTASMCEAFNLPALEAMACGLPVISTKFGGMSDFVNEENGWLIDGELIDVTWDIMHEGNRWNKVNLEELKKTMRTVFELWKNPNPDNDDILERKKDKALETASQFTWLKSAKKLLNIINEEGKHEKDNTQE